MTKDKTTTKSKSSKSKPKAKEKKASTSLKLSVSSVQTFQSCKAKWYYRYILNLPTVQTYHLTTGSFIHKILEIFLRRYLKTRDLRDAGNVAFFLARKDKELSPHLTEEITNEGKSWLKFLVKRFEQKPESIPNTLSVESPFNFKIENENSEIAVRGFIDRIDQVDEDTIKIVDYKTSSNPDYLDVFQLATYAIATEKKYPNKKITASYELIRHEFEDKPFEISEDVKQQAIETFKTTATEIIGLKDSSPDAPWETNPTRLCSYCPYKVRCEIDRSKKTKWQV
jgi:ATP-dependent helicase/DNAse subunit B